jgi:hypothetical protein
MEPLIQQNFCGKTRDNFATLDASINDYTGASPAGGGNFPNRPVSTVNDITDLAHPHRAAVASLQELASGSGTDNS